MLSSNAAITKEEQMVWKGIISMKNSNHDPFVFRFGRVMGIKSHFVSLAEETWLASGVIDIWSVILNQKEKYRSKESPSRFFFSTNPCFSSVSKCKIKNNYFRYFDNFVNDVSHEMERNDLTSLNNIDLVFFPVIENKHFYLLCFDLKTMRYDVIDNMETDKPIHTCYGPTPATLKTMFSNFLREKKHAKADDVDKTKPESLQIPWKNVDNLVDCGVYTMRHMETYMGNGGKRWNSGLKKTNFDALKTLRVRYCHHILTFQGNELKQFVSDKAKDFNKAKKP